MALFHVTDTVLEPVGTTTFAAQNLYERRDIQRYLRRQIGVIGSNLIVLAEEFGEWVDSDRRIDLLCLDASADLVVVEIKRGEDGGFMELQALRYAAMISTMTFDQCIDIYARTHSLDQEGARSVILDFLGWEAPNEDDFAADTRIILVSSNFSKELTTSVLWLADRGVDIRCVRLQPYRMDSGTLLLDVQQIIPLPESAAFQTQIGVKRQAERKDRVERHDLRFRFWDMLLQAAKTRTNLHAGLSPGESTWLAGSIGRAGFSLIYGLTQSRCDVRLWIGMGAAKRELNMLAFDMLFAQRDMIEAEFGAPLDWCPMPEADACKVRYFIDGGYRSPEQHWPDIQDRMIDAMIRLDAAFRERVKALQLSAA